MCSSMGYTINFKIYFSGENRTKRKHIYVEVITHFMCTLMYYILNFKCIFSGRNRTERKNIFKRSYRPVQKVYYNKE